MSVKSLAEKALEQGKGILRLAPAWVPRSFCIPGRRIKLHPDDYYALGAERGGIDERWLASTTSADNGPLTGQDEGLSFVVFEDGSQTEQFLLRDGISELGSEIVGGRLWDRYQGWPLYSKFFDNLGPLPHHVHLEDKYAKLVGQAGKPEAYYFPPQLNNYPGRFPYTFFGLKPGTTREEVKECLRNFCKGDNKITGLSIAYELELGTGWDVPPGVLHAPGSLCTYEPQKASDIFAMYQSLVDKQVISEEMLWNAAPGEKKGDFDYLVDVLDWESNVDPEFAARHFMRPQPVRNAKEMQAEGYIEKWICYKSDNFSAKELTVFPGKTITVRDGGAYGMVMVQGHGTMGEWHIETPALIRFKQLTNDEYFVTERAALEGVRITNLSGTDPIVMLKHFGPGNPDCKGV